MREVVLQHVEVMNETEQVFVFVTVFNKETYGVPVIMNMVLSVEKQDAEFRKTILYMQNMKTKEADEAEKLNV
jgi:hypothetical protein